MPKNIIIVGGGTAGIVVFNGLADKLAASEAALILVTPRPYFTWLPTSLRMVVTSEGVLENSVLMPFPDTFNRANRKVVLAKVTSIQDDKEAGQFVTLGNGENIEFSVLILSPGSKWEGPLNFPESQEGDLWFIKSWRKDFAQAKEIVLIGGGAVGVELSGEIIDTWPTKAVTIVHGPPLLLNATYPEKFRQNVMTRVSKRGVKLVLNDYVDDLVPKDGKITTRKGTAIAADLVILTRGPKPNTKFVESLGPDVLDEGGYVKVQETLQLAYHPRILAAGNVIDYREGKQAFKIRGHAAVIVSNALSLIRSSGDDMKPLARYKGTMEAIVLSTGKNGGAGYFDVLWGITVGDYFARMMKLKGLMIDMAKKQLRL